MTHKALHYTDHARKRMGELDVTRSDVRTILAAGAALPDVEARGDLYHEKWLRLGRHDVGVSYIERKDRVLVITVEHIDWERRG